jgi:hypothetical protein
MCTFHYRDWIHPHKPQSVNTLLNICACVHMCTFLCRDFIHPHKPQSNNTLSKIYASLFKRSFHVMIINVYTFIVGIFTDLDTCLHGSESIILAGKDTMTNVLRIGSLYRGLCTYAHIHRYLGEWVIWLWLVRMYIISTEDCAQIVHRYLGKCVVWLWLVETSDP